MGIMLTVIMVAAARTIPRYAHSSSLFSTDLNRLIRQIGIDPIADEGLTRHRLLLSQRDIVIIENLTNLDKIGEGLFLFAALPLKYENADGAPVRAVAMLEEE